GFGAAGGPRRAGGGQWLAPADELRRLLEAFAPLAVGARGGLPADERLAPGDEVAPADFEPLAAEQPRAGAGLALRRPCDLGAAEAAKRGARRRVRHHRTRGDA